MARIRHWKQHFDATAKLQFRRTTKVNRAGIETAQPGDAVTKELADFLGRLRLRRWWEAGIIELVEAEPETIKEPEVEPEPEGEDEEMPEGIQSLGNGWYQVGSKKVRGIENARKALED